MTFLTLTTAWTCFVATASPRLGLYGSYREPSGHPASTHIDFKIAE